MVRDGKMPPVAIPRLFHKAWRRGFDLEGAPRWVDPIFKEKTP